MLAVCQGEDRIMEDRASPKRIALGFGDLHADAGDHIGHFYRTIEEWKELVIPFFRLGLEGDGCEMEDCRSWWCR